MGKNKLLLRLRYKLDWLYDTVRYDIPRFIRNLWTFRKALYEFRWYDYHGTLLMLKTCVDIKAHKTEHHGLEINETRRKKVYYMKRVAYLLDQILQDDFATLAENRLGRKLIFKEWRFEPIEGSTSTRLVVEDQSESEHQHNMEIYTEASRIEREMWTEVFDILKGDIYTYDLVNNPKFKSKMYEEIHNGKGLINWWD